jgi:hypothetical protein
VRFRKAGFQGGTVVFAPSFLSIAVVGTVKSIASD